MRLYCKIAFVREFCYVYNHIFQILGESFMFKKLLILGLIFIAFQEYIVCSQNWAVNDKSQSVFN